MAHLHRTGPPSDITRSRQLRRLVAHAYREIPFYRERFDAAAVKPSDVRGLADLHLLPIVEKTDLVTRPVAEITAGGIDPAALVSTMTSGYSGEPFVVRRTRAEQTLWARSWLDDLLAAGLRRGDRVASVFVDREERPDGIALLPALGLIEERMVDCCLDPEEILEDLERDPPTFLRGMPSVIERVARLMTPADRQILRPRVVWLSGEVVAPAVRARIEAAFGAPVHDAYGTHEVGLVASDCPHPGLKHLGRPDLVVEIVEPSVPAPPGVGEIVVTPLGFFAAPLLRYRITDAVTPGPPDCPCGRRGPTLSRIEGRTLDYFELPGGRAVHPYRILGPLLAAAPWIRQYQLVQTASDRIVFRHVPHAGADPESAGNLEAVVADVLGPQVRLEVEEVSRIEPPEGQKSRPIVSLAARRIALDARTSVYLHSPSEAPDAPTVAVRIPEFERYGERALLLARPGDLVCVADAVDERYLDFLASLGIGPSAADVLVVDGVAPGRGLSERLADDPAGSSRLAALLSDRPDPILVPFFASPATAALARVLETRLRRRIQVEGGPPSLVRRVHEKSVARALARRLGVPVAPGEVVKVRRTGCGDDRDHPALRRAVARWSAPTGGVIVRGSSGASGSSTFVAAAEGLDALLDEVSRRTDNDAYLVEPFYEAAVSPNVEVVVEPGADGHLHAAVTDQILDAGLVYQGSRHPTRARHAARMIEDARRIAGWMRERGFHGRVGFDFVEPRGGRAAPDYFLCEINPRVNGASYPLALLGRLARRAAELGAPPPAAFVARFARVEAEGFGEIEERCGSLLFDPGRGAGVVPHTTGGLAFGKLGVTSLAESRARAQEILDVFLERAGSARPAPASR